MRKVYYYFDKFQESSIPKIIPLFLSRKRYTSGDDEKQEIETISEYSGQNNNDWEVYFLDMHDKLKFKI